MIDEKRLNEIFLDCFFKTRKMRNGEPIEKGKMIIIEGIAATYGFNSIKVSEYEKEINLMLDDTNITFKNGWSFLNLCFDKDNNQWTGSHKAMEQLMCLGMAIKRVYYCMNDREFWKILPGGMPYIVIK